MTIEDRLNALELRLARGEINEAVALEVAVALVEVIAESRMVTLRLCDKLAELDALIRRLPPPPALPPLLPSAGGRAKRKRAH